MFVLALVLILVGLALRYMVKEPLAQTVGKLIVVVGVVVLIIAVIYLITPSDDVEAASVVPLGMSLALDPLYVWARRKYDDLVCTAAGMLPQRLRRQVVVNAAVKARYPDQIAGRYCGPEGIEYKDLWEAA